MKVTILIYLLNRNSVKLHSGLGRLYLHIGDIRVAQQHFTTAEKEGGNGPTDKAQLLLNR